MKNIIIGWLAAKGVVLANDAADTVVVSALQKAFTDQATVLANDNTEGRVLVLENEKTQLTAQVTSLTTEKTTLANERDTFKKSAVTHVVDLAITQGRLKVADRDATITTLGNAADFPAESKKLLEAAKIVRIPGADVRSGKVLANDGTDPGADPRDDYKQAIAEHMTKNPGCDPMAAHKAVMKAKPELAAALAARNTAK